MKDIEKLKLVAKQREHEFIIQRADMKREFPIFAQTLEKVDPILLAGIDIPNLDPRVLFSALYETPINYEKYKEQFQNYEVFRKQIEKRRLELVLKAKQEVLQC